MGQSNALSQNSDTSWTHTYGGSNDDFGNEVLQTPDGGYLIAGSTNSYGAGESDFWVIRTDSVGNELWSNSYGDSGVQKGYSIVKKINSNNYIVLGNTISFNNNAWDVWYQEISSQGNDVNSYTFGNSGGGHDIVYSIDRGFEGYIMAGAVSTDTTRPLKAWIIKTDTNGDPEQLSFFGGTREDVANSIKNTRDTGIILIGYTFSYGAGGSDVWLIKTDGFGSYTNWTNTFGGSRNDKGKSGHQTADGGYIITGFTRSYGAGGSDVWLIKTDDAGNLEWSKTFGGVGEEVGNSVVQTSDGGYIITGYTTSYGAGLKDVWLIKTNQSGNTMWMNTFGGIGNDVGNSVIQSFDGGYIIAGETNSYGAGGSDVWLIKVPQNGLIAIKENDQVLVKNYSLSQNHPNPFNPLTNISYSLPVSGDVTLIIYNILGEEVSRLVNGFRQAGEYQTQWNASNVSSGIYFYRLRAGDYAETKKMVLLK